MFSAPQAIDCAILAIRERNACGLLTTGLKFFDFWFSYCSTQFQFTTDDFRLQRVVFDCCPQHQRDYGVGELRPPEVTLDNQQVGYKIIVDPPLLDGLAEERAFDFAKVGQGEILLQPQGGRVCAQPGSSPSLPGHTLPPEMKSGEDAVILTQNINRKHAGASRAHPRPAHE